ncbi:MAG TPA: hypothetical protein VIG72_01115 [Pontibacter sp.]
MNYRTTYRKAATGILTLIFPLVAGCSVVGGNSYSDNSLVRAQQEEVEQLEAEYRDAERLANEAEQRKKAAKNRLKAAEHELKALKSQAKGS